MREKPFQGASGEAGCKGCRDSFLTPTRARKEVRDHCTLCTPAHLLHPKRTAEAVVDDVLNIFPGAVVTERRSVGLDDLVRFEESKQPQPAQASLFGDGDPEPRPRRGRPGRGKGGRRSG